MFAAPFVEAGNYKHGTRVFAASFHGERQKGKGVRESRRGPSYFYNKYIHMIANLPPEKRTLIHYMDTRNLVNSHPLILLH